MRRLPALAAIAALIAALAYFFSLRAGRVYIFKGLAGPDAPTSVPQASATPWTEYESGSDSSLAILLTDPKSNWLGLAHGFRSAGIPFSIATDYRRATRHRVVLAYPTVSGAKLSSEASEALTRFVASGGVLIGFEVLGGGLERVFGFSQAVPLRARFRLVFTHPEAGSDALEREVPIDNPRAASAMGAYAYTSPADPPLAVYEDGGAAITDHRWGEGRAVAFGFDLGALLLKGYNNRQESMARSYDNGYEPTLDVLLHLVEDIYRRGDDRAVIVGPVPDGKDLAVLLTHDIDYTRSLANALVYARTERDAGVRATYFVQTKYIRDYNDDAILGADSPGELRQLLDLGMEIASHTVSHSRTFAHFPMGDGTERYPDYRPFVADKETTNGGTILGELRVSRFLLESLVPGLRVTSFRPGYLSDPYGLPQALSATGYRWSSSVTANDSLTHLPYQLNYARETQGEVPVFEFPITIADGPPPLAERVQESVLLARKIARKGGLCVVLIHPDVVEPKLGFEKQFVEGVRAFSWFGTLDELGRWWSARDSMRVASEWRGGKLAVRLEAPYPIDGLTLAPPAGMHPVPGQALVRGASERSTVLGRLEGAATVEFVR